MQAAAGEHDSRTREGNRAYVEAERAGIWTGLSGTLDLEVVGVCVSMDEKWTLELEVSDFLLSSFPPTFWKIAYPELS